MSAPDHVIREADLKSYDGLGITQRQDYVNRDIYPPPIKLSDGGRAKAWLGSEIAAFQRWRKARRDGTAPAGSSWRDFLDHDRDDDTNRA